METNNRPNPDQLLSAIKNAENKSQRGKLKIFLGMCPGVGKTYSMLKAAQDLIDTGIHLVVGIVETHGRSETQALLHGLNVIEKKKIDYRGNVLEEMDLDKILSEKPDIVLVDELAHTNAPGSRHLKRYKDVEELLNAGIDVYTTLNVQHIESRSDIVQEITGVVVRETVPDTVLNWAEEIRLIDVSVQELLKRLKEGKVYLGERAVTAADNFFKEENLTALREIALRFTAEVVDSDLINQMTIKKLHNQKSANERLLVSISSSPYSARLIRTTKRMAQSLESPWVALYIDNGDSLDDEAKITLQKNINLAKELGAEVITTLDLNIVSAICRISEEKNITQIVMGRPDKRFFRDLFNRGSLLDQLVRETSEIDIHVIKQVRKPRYKGFKLTLPELNSELISYWYTLWFVLGITFIALLCKDLTGYRTIGFFYLLAVIAVAGLSSRGPSFFAALLSVVTWNFLFIPPLYTFAINTSEDVLMCLTFFVVASFAGILTSRIRKQEVDLRQREFRANILYELISDLSQSSAENEIAKTAIKCVEKLFKVKSNVLLFDENSNLENAYSKSFINPKIDEKDLAVAIWSFENKKRAGWSTETLSSSPCLSLPLIGKKNVLGVLLIYPEVNTVFTLEQENLLSSVVNNMALAFEREKLSIESQNTKVIEESEKLHQTILNSVSHEIRTPLTSLIGMSSALKEERSNENKETRNMIIEEIIDSSLRLNRVVENLLDMTRLSSGHLQLKTEHFELQDLVNSTLEKLKKSLSHNKIEVLLHKDVELIIKGDFRLLEHALINIIYNSICYSPKNSSIKIELMSEIDKAMIIVSDEGKGFPKEAIGKIFERFYRVPGSPAGGVGLGLSIVKNIIDLHGGLVEAFNRKDKQGAIIVLKLPLIKLPKNITESL